MQRIDLREYKGELRTAARQYRNSLTAEEKRRLDDLIYSRLIATYQYRKCKVLLIYASTAIEVDTFEIIERALADGKRIALPRCIKGTRNMEFHYIESFDDLSPGTFSVLEPDENSMIVSDFTGCLMILPAITVDYDGYRLGYGKGYYDRYMSRFSGPSVVLCYSCELVGKLYIGLDVLRIFRGIKAENVISRL